MSGSDTTPTAGDGNEARPLPPPDAPNSATPTSSPPPSPPSTPPGPVAEPGPDAELRSRFAAAASAVDTGSTDDALGSVHSTATRRRRRRNGVLGVAAAGLLVASGVVIGTLIGDDDGDDLIVSAPVPEAADDATADDDESGGSSREAGDGVEPGDDPAPPPSDVVADAAESSVVVTDATFEGGTEWIVPWKGGFLSLRQEFASQPLPTELPEDITALFPDEVVQLFEDAGGLPPTISEATTMLQEAGLLDVVSEVISENPDAFDAIYSVPMPEPITTARTSPDGLEWTDVELVLPAGVQLGYRTISTGERLVLFVDEYPPPPDLVGDPTGAPFPEALPYAGGPVSVSLWWTDDLESWSSQVIDLPDTGGEGEAPYLFTEAHVGGVAANDDRWVFTLDTFENFDVYPLLPPEVLERFNGEFGYGYWHDENGVTVEIHGEDGVTDATTYTWAELGVDPPPVDIINPSYSPPSSTIYSAAWGAEPVITESASTFGRMLAWDGGFAHQHERGVSVSTDGIEWSTTSGLPTPAQGWVSGLMPVPGSVVAFVSGPMNENVASFRLDPVTLAWETTEVPDLPDGFATWSQPTTAAMLYNVETFPEFEESPAPEPFVASYEHDGFRLDTSVSFDGSSYTLVDIATGDVLSSEEVAGDPGITPFEHVIENPDGSITFLSPETGDEIVTIPVSALDTVQGDTDDALTGVEVRPADDEVFGEVWEPDFHILATDGETWINEPVEFGEEYGPAGDPVIVDGIVLVPNFDGSYLRIEF